MIFKAEAISAFFVFPLTLESLFFNNISISGCSFLYEKAIVVLPSFLPNGFLSVLTKCAKDGRYERYSLSGNRFGTIGRGFDEV
jgi:hypothetical protein